MIVGGIYRFGEESVTFYYCGSIRNQLELVHTFELIGNGNYGVNLDEREIWIPNWVPRSSDRYWLVSDDDTLMDKLNKVQPLKPVKVIKKHKI